MYLQESLTQRTLLEHLNLIQKLLDINIKKQHCGVDKVCFYMNNLIISISPCTHTVHILQTKQSFYNQRK